MMMNDDSHLIFVSRYAKCPSKRRAIYTPSNEIRCSFCLLTIRYSICTITWPDCVRHGKPSLIYHPCPAWLHWCPGRSAWWKESCPVTGRLLWPAADSSHRYFHEQCFFLPARQLHVNADQYWSIQFSDPNWALKMSPRAGIFLSYFIFKHRNKNWICIEIFCF